MAIELNRRFVEFDDEKADPDLVAHFGRTEATREWDDLLKLRRVVFLAAAGSGKTTEMTTRARQQLDAGYPSFYATLEDVGASGRSTYGDCQRASSSPAGGRASALTTPGATTSTT